MNDMNENEKTNQLPAGITAEWEYVTSDREKYPTLEQAVEHQAALDILPMITRYLDEKRGVLGEDGEGRQGRSRELNQIVAWEEWQLKQGEE